MRSGPKASIAGGLAVALLGAVLVVAYARSVEGRAAPADGVPVMVTTGDVAAGTAWEAATKSMARRTVPPYARPASAVEAANELTGKRAVRNLSKGAIVTRSDFGASKEPPASGLQVPPGHNAVSVAVGLPQGVARYPVAGDLVNLYASFTGGPGAQIETTTKLLLSNVQVLATRTPDAAGKPSGDVLFTLALTPGDAERVIFARQNGTLWFGLVHAGDGPAATSGHSFSTVLG